MKYGKRIPDDINEAVNPKDLNTKLNNALKHQFWKNNSIPVYDKDKSHLSSDIDLGPSEPDSFLNFFWLDEDLELIVKESNKYSSKKIEKKSHKSKRIKDVHKCLYVYVNI